MKIIKRPSVRKTWSPAPSGTTLHLVVKPSQCSLLWNAWDIKLLFVIFSCKTNMWHNVDGVADSKHLAKYVFPFVRLPKLSDPKSKLAHNTAYNNSACSFYIPTIRPFLGHCSLLITVAFRADEIRILLIHVYGYYTLWIAAGLLVNRMHI